MSLFILLFYLCLTIILDFYLAVKFFNSYKKEDSLMIVL